MTLEKLLAEYPYEIVKSSEWKDATSEARYASEQMIEHLTIDSRQMKPNSVFVAIKGMMADGHDFIHLAIEKGATAIVVDKDISIPVDPSVMIVKVDNTKKALAMMAAAFYDHPEKNLTIMAVTGTNGKTSITYYLESILETAGIIVGVIGTNGATINGKDMGISYETSTTPDTIDLFHILSVMVKAGAKYVVMEASSHALYLEKLYHLPIEVGIYSNLSPEHLDFHPDMEAYKQAKMKLFKQSAISIINMDDIYGAAMASVAMDRCCGYGVDALQKETTFLADNIILSPHYSTFDLVYNEEVSPFHVKVPGLFSIYNALSAVAACLAVGISVANCQLGIAHMLGVPGRFETVKSDKDIVVIVDYAHTPDSLQTILKAVAPLTSSQIIAVFGCGGDRDKSKRPEMAKIGIQYANFCILTSDNPRSENPDDIIADMVKGISSNEDKYLIIPDRELAIEKAISMAKEGDVVVIAGKGHETNQEINGKRYPFDDKEIARKYMTLLP